MNGAGEASPPRLFFARILGGRGSGLDGQAPVDDGNVDHGPVGHLTRDERPPYPGLQLALQGRLPSTHVTKFVFQAADTLAQLLQARCLFFSLIGRHCRGGNRKG